MGKQKRAERPLEGLGSLAEVSFDGGATWWELRGASNVDHESGQAETSQVQGFRFRSTTRGQIPIAPITYALAAWDPNSYWARRMRRARDGNETVTVRHTYFGERFRAADANAAAGSFLTAAAGAAPAVLGAVTVGGAAADAIMALVASTLTRGDSIIYDGGIDANGLILDAAKVKVIEGLFVEADGSVKKIGNAAADEGLLVTDGAGAKATMQAAAPAQIRSTGARFQVGAKITQFGSFTAGATGDTPVASGVEFLPQQEVPQSAAYYGDEP